MRVQFERSGGFAGMRAEATIDSDDLSQAQARELQDMVSAANFFSLPSKMEDSSGADRFQYRVTIESEGQRHTVECGEESAPESLRRLLEYITRLARSSRE
jgi:hypothetical protein